MAAAMIHSHQQSQARSAEEAQELAFGEVWDQAGNRVNPQHSSQAHNRPILEGGRRKSSIKFNTGPAEETIRRESVANQDKQPFPASSAERNPSPPPPMPYSRGIAFDTFASRDAPVDTFSIQYKHHDFIYTPRTRTFIVGTDAKDYSEYALEWCFDELVDDGDEIVCLRVISEEGTERRNYKQEADRLLESVIAKNAIERKAISLKMELAVGKVTEVIQGMIHLYEPVAIVVGTRGRPLTGMQGLMSGSVSKYCLQRSPVPTIVVRPSSKRTKKKLKRQQEMGRSVYSGILSQAQSVSSKNVLDHGRDTDDYTVRSGDQEAAAVDRAVGPRKSILRNAAMGGGPMRPDGVAPGDEFNEDGEPVQRFALPIGYLATERAPTAETAVANSPFLQMLAEDARAERRGSRASSPAPSEGALTDDNADEPATGIIVEDRRPSTRSQTPWLNSILSRPEKKTRSRSRDGGGRSRSR